MKKPKKRDDVDRILDVLAVMVNALQSPMGWEAVAFASKELRDIRDERLKSKGKKP